MCKADCLCFSLSPKTSTFALNNPLHGMALKSLQVGLGVHLLMTPSGKQTLHGLGPFRMKPHASIALVTLTMTDNARRLTFFFFCLIGAVLLVALPI